MNRWADGGISGIGIYCNTNSNQHNLIILTGDEIPIMIFVWDSRQVFTDYCCDLHGVPKYPKVGNHRLVILGYSRADFERI